VIMETVVISVMSLVFGIILLRLAYASRNISEGTRFVYAIIAIVFIMASGAVFDADLGEPRSINQLPTEIYVVRAVQYEINFVYLIISDYSGEHPLFFKLEKGSVAPELKVGDFIRKTEAGKIELVQ